MGPHQSISETELDEIHAFAVQLAKDAGKMLLEAVDARSCKTGGAGHVEKESAVDLVTQTDEGQYCRALISIEAVLPNIFKLLLLILSRKPKMSRLSSVVVCWLSILPTRMTR